MRNRRLVSFLFYFLLFSYPLLSLLWRRSYSFLTSEVVVIFLLLAVLCITLVIVLSNVRLVIANLLSSVLVTMAFMLQFNLVFVGVVFCTLICLILAWQLRTKFQLYSLPLLISLIIGAYVDSFEEDGYLNSIEHPINHNLDLPPVIHIILDGFIGMDGLPSYPASEQLRDELNAFFNQYKFQVFTRAYSRYASTGDALYSALNFRNSAESKFGLEHLSRSEHKLKSNAQFDAMQKIGYRFNIYQTEYMDFCKSNAGYVDRCWEYTQPNVDTIYSARKVSTRIKMLLKVLVSQSNWLSNLVVSRELLLDQGIANYDPRVFINLEEDLFNEPRGKYFFAHILLPHGPFAFMNDCSVSYNSPIWARYAYRDYEPVQVDEIYEVRTMKYFEQVDCAVNSMRQIFEKMKMSQIYDQSIIVLHGDHGSKIGRYRPLYKNLGLLTHTEYRANYSTLFAVKFPGDEGRLDSRVLPLSTLLEEFTAGVWALNLDKEAPITMDTLPDSNDKKGAFIYVQGVAPAQRVDINIFDE